MSAGRLQAHWEGPGIVQVRGAQGLSHPTASQLGHRGPLGTGPFHRQNGPDSILSCLVRHRGRKRGGRNSPVVLAWAAGTFRRREAWAG